MSAQSATKELTTTWLDRMHHTKLQSSRATKLEWIATSAVSGLMGRPETAPSLAASFMEVKTGAVQDDKGYNSRIR